jgi:hypothetical protein
MSQALDQFAHFGQGVSIALPWALPIPPVVAGGLSGGIGLFWRELSQLRRSNGFKQWKADRKLDLESEGWWKLWHMKDRILDITFGVLGGLAIGAVVGFLQ